MKLTLLDAKTLGDDINFGTLHALGEVVSYDGTKEEEVESHIADSDVVIVNKVKLNEKTLQNVKNLKLICISATGFDNVDLDYCRKRGIAVTNVVGYSTHSVAQLTLSMALSLSTNLPQFTDFVNDGSYTKSGVANRLTPVYHELNGKTWGVVGLGNIGKQVARVAEAMGLNVIAFKRTPDNAYPCVTLDELFSKSDIISIHLPLNDETRGIIGKNLIAKMKKNAILINVARGAVTDETALADAILENRIGGLGVDVYTEEPFSENHPFSSILNHENVCLTPHMAWGAFEARQRCLDEIAENIKSFTRGEFRNRLEI